MGAICRQKEDPVIPFFSSNLRQKHFDRLPDGIVNSLATLQISRAVISLTVTQEGSVSG